MAADPERAGRSVGSPYSVGFAAAVGVGIAYLLFRVLIDARNVLIVLSLALFFAVGMDPAVRALQRLGARRGLAVGIVFLVLAGAATGFGFAVVPPLVDQITNFVHKIPEYLTDLQHNHRIAKLDGRFHLITKLQGYVNSGALLQTLAGNVLTAGTAVASTVFDGFSVLILTLYFMAYLDQITSFAYRLVPRSHRLSAEDVASKIMRQVGEYVAGSLVIGLIAGVVSLIFLTVVGAPFPIALAAVIALLDVIPLIGATVAAVIVCTIVLIASTPAGIATIVFLIGYQLVENHVLIPRLFKHRVQVNPVATIVGALAGATLLGVVGFLLAIPLAATGSLIVREVIIPRQRRH